MDIDGVQARSWEKTNWMSKRRRKDKGKSKEEDKDEDEDKDKDRDRDKDKEKDKDEGRKETSRGVCGMQRAQERQEAFTKHVNDIILEKEMRWSSSVCSSDHAEGLECAKGVLSRFDHPHPLDGNVAELDLAKLYGSGYFVDDVKGGTINREMCIAARKLEMDLFPADGGLQKDAEIELATRGPHNHHKMSGYE